MKLLPLATILICFATAMPLHAEEDFIVTTHERTTSSEHGVDSEPSAAVINACEDQADAEEFEGEEKELFVEECIDDPEFFLPKK